MRDAEKISKSVYALQLPLRSCPKGKGSDYEEGWENLPPKTKSRLISGTVRCRSVVLHDEYDLAK